MEIFKLVLKVVGAILLFVLFCVFAMFGFKPSRVKGAVKKAYQSGVEGTPQPTPEELQDAADQSEADSKAKKSKQSKDFVTNGGTQPTWECKPNSQARS